jgi:voltage-gated potassium channel
VLRGRLGWLASFVAVTVLGTSELLYAFSGYRRFADALHATALGAITGEPLGRPDAFAQITEVLLAIFSVVVFGTLAGTLGAFFLQTRDAPAEATAVEAAQDQ